ncbi:hypothetical protein CsSME_00038006 [Camellia sinensis var. sinensis]
MIDIEKIQGKRCYLRCVIVIVLLETAEVKARLEALLLIVPNVNGNGEVRWDKALSTSQDLLSTSLDF